MALDQRRTSAAEDHQSFFVLPRRVPSHPFTRLEAEETAAHARRLRHPFQQGAVSFWASERHRSGCGFGIWEEESETAATNNPTGTLKNVWQCDAPHAFFQVLPRLGDDGEVQSVV